MGHLLARLWSCLHVCVLLSCVSGESISDFCDALWICSCIVDCLMELSVFTGAKEEGGTTSHTMHIFTRKGQTTSAQLHRHFPLSKEDYFGLLPCQWLDTQLEKQVAAQRCHTNETLPTPKYSACRAWAPPVFWTQIFLTTLCFSCFYFL